MDDHPQAYSTGVVVVGLGGTTEPIIEDGAHIMAHVVNEAALTVELHYAFPVGAVAVRRAISVGQVPPGTQIAEARWAYAFERAGGVWWVAIET